MTGTYGKGVRNEWHCRAFESKHESRHTELCAAREQMRRHRVSFTPALSVGAGPGPACAAPDAAVREWNRAWAARVSAIKRNIHTVLTWVEPGTTKARTCYRLGASAMRCQIVQKAEGTGLEPSKPPPDFESRARFSVTERHILGVKQPNRVDFGFTKKVPALKTPLPFTWGRGMGTGE